MFSPRKAPPLLTQYPSFHTTIRKKAAGPMRQATQDPAKPKKKGPQKGMKFIDPNDPTKFISRAKVINFRPRGPTKIPSYLKSTLQSKPSRIQVCN